MLKVEFVGQKKRSKDQFSNFMSAVQQFNSIKLKNLVRAPNYQIYKLNLKSMVKRDDLESAEVCGYKAAKNLHMNFDGFVIRLINKAHLERTSIWKYFRIVNIFMRFFVVNVVAFELSRINSTSLQNSY